jgi:GNAT superfamily N-acetyltransferase
MTATDTLGGPVWQQQRYGWLVSTDAARLDLPWIHRILSQHSYWAKEIPFEIVRRSVENSLCFGVYDGAVQVGFARMITDRATMGYLCDVIIEPSHRGRGLSRLLMECIRSHPDLQTLRRWVLVTADAHGLYEKFGFQRLAAPGAYMEINEPGLYERLKKETEGRAG